MITTTARPSGPSRIDLLSEADELDIQPVEFIQHLEEVFDRPAIRSDAHTRTTSNRLRRTIEHPLIQTRTSGLRTTDPVRVLLDDLISPLLGHLPEIMELRLGMLIEGHAYRGRRVSLRAIRVSHIT